MDKYAVNCIIRRLVGLIISFGPFLKHRHDNCKTKFADSNILNFSLVLFQLIFLLPLTEGRVNYLNTHANGCEKRWRNFIGTYENPENTDHEVYMQT